MRRELKIKQHNISDCGAACLCSIGYFYGVKHPIAQIREFCGCTQSGITLKGIIEGASKMGLKASGYKSTTKDISALNNINSPIIAHVKTDTGLLHYVVVYKVRPTNITIMDPAIGDFIELSYAEFTEQWSGFILVVIIGNNFAAKDVTTPIYKRVIDILKFHRKSVALILLGSLTLVLLGIGNSLILQRVVDSGLKSNNNILPLLAIMLALFMMASIHISYARTLILVKNNLIIDARLITGYLTKLVNLPLSFFNSYEIGDINSRISDAFKIRALISEGVISAIVSILTLIGTILTMFIFNYKITLLVLLFIPLYIALFYISLRINKKYNRAIVKQGAHFESEVIDVISSISDFKHFNSTDYAYNRVESSFGSLIYKMDRGASYANMLSTASNIITKSLLIFILIYGGYEVTNHHMSLGEVISFYLLTSYLTSPISNLINMNSIITEGIVSSERLFEIIDLDDEDIMNKELKFNFRKGETLTIKDLDFSYIGRGKLFSRFNLTIPPASITAITGESGCGKSTLGSLLLKDCTPNSGIIKYGETNIASIPIKEWRESISIIPQRCNLLNGTILENIVYNSENYTIDNIYKLCSSVGLSNTLERLPNGILTNVGRGGNNLSGGECQKIAIARALFMEASIYIFDEATSSLDNDSEAEILNLITKLKIEGKSIIMITHRLANLKYADKIIKLSAHSEW